MQKLILTSLAVGLSAGMLASPGVPRKVQGVDYESLYLQKHRTMTATEVEFEDNPNPLPSEGSFTFDDITNWTGTGKNRAALVIQWNDDREENAMVFGYRWDGEATGVQMLRDVTEANPRLYSLIQYTDVSSAVDPNGGFTVCGIGWDFDQDRDIFLIDNEHGDQTYESESGLFLHPRGIDSVSSPSYDYDSWLAGDTDDFWGAGWYSSYWSYWVRSVSDGEFKYSSVGASGRLLTDGCWDGWNFSKGMSTYEWKPFVAAPVITDDEIFTAGGLCYRILSPEFKTAAVVAPVGDDSAYAGEVVVPACVQYGDDVYEVTSVEAEAFKGSTVTNVIISAGSRLDIGKYAFASIPTLTHIVVNGDGSQLRLEEGVFSACPLLESVEISDSSDIIRIGDSLFMDCVSLTEEGIPAVLWDVDIIPANMYASTGITRLDIERAQEIGEGAFAGCVNLASLTLGSKVVRIGDRAFAGDDALEEVIVRFVNIPDINSNVFAEWVYCSAELSVPYTTADSFRSKETWKEFAYIRERDFELLPGVIVSSGDINYKICEGDGLYLAVSHKEYTGIPEIPAYVEIGGESYPVKAIDDYAFYRCTLEGAPVLPSTIESIGKRAFSGISYPKGSTIEYKLSASVSRLGTAAFAEPRYVYPSPSYHVNIEESPDRQPITEIPDSLFTGMTLKSCNLLTKEVRRIGNYAFAGAGITADMTDFENLEAIGESGLGGCKVTFRQASALRELGKNAFYYQSSGSATYADDLLTMRRDVVYGEGAFRGLSGYTRLKIEEGVQSIPDAMFHSSKVVEIEGGFPESLTYIGNEAFRSTSMLTGPLTIPATVMELGSLAFFFSNLSEGVIIPADSRLTAVDAFGSTDIPFIHIPDGVKEIGANAFNYCRNLKKVTGMAGVTKIGSSAFSSCSIEEISLPDGLEIIDDHAFYNTKLVSIDMPEGVTTVNGAFRGCTSLQEILLPSTLRDLKVTSSGWVPFYTNDTKLPVNVWYCMTPDSPFTPESAALVCRNENFYTKVKTPFTHYYVLDGMKDHMKALCDVFDYEEVAAAITEMPVEMRQNGLQVEMTCNPVFTQSIASEADKATMSDAEELADAVRIPEHFANANAGHIHSQTTYTLESKNEVLPASLEVEVDFDKDGKPVVNATFEGPSEGGQYRLVAEHPVKGRVESDWFKSDIVCDVATLRADIAGYVVADGVVEISAPETCDVGVYGIDGALLFKGRGNCRYVIPERKIVIVMIGTEVYKVVI